MSAPSNSPSAPRRVEVVGDFLAIKWNDTEESVLPLESVRRACPCARCSGEPDVTGAVRRMGPAPTYTARSFEVVSLERVGTYAIALRWGDGHDTGIFTWSLLRQLGEVDGA